jgi:hypothetical protein
MSDEHFGERVLLHKIFSNYKEPCKGRRKMNNDFENLNEFKIVLEVAKKQF